VDSHHRTERIAESLRVELEEILNYELSDPRITTVAVTEVQLSPCHKKAHIRLALGGTEAEQADCMQAIEKANGYVKTLVADRIDIFRLPDFYFDPDLDPSVRDKVASLLRRVKRGRPRG